jgi:hypothetical protein
VPKDGVKSLNDIEIGTVQTTLEERQEMERVLLKHQSVFAIDPTVPKATRTEPFDIQLKDATCTPIRFQCRPVRREWRSEFEQLLINMLEHGLIRRSHDSEWAFPIVIVPKKTGKIRMCVDFRLLNDITVRRQEVMPRTPDLLLRLTGARFFTAMDMASGFAAVPLTERAQNYATFVTPFGTFAMTRMQMGLLNASFHYQRIMNNALLGTGQQSYIDDLIWGLEWNSRGGLACLRKGCRSSRI